MIHVALKIFIPADFSYDFREVNNNDMEILRKIPQIAYFREGCKKGEEYGLLPDPPSTIQTLTSAVSKFLQSFLYSIVLHLL